MCRLAPPAALDQDAAGQVPAQGQGDGAATDHQGPGAHPAQADQAATRGDSHGAQLPTQGLVLDPRQFHPLPGVDAVPPAHLSIHIFGHPNLGWLKDF